MYSKYNQLYKQYKIHRDPLRLRQLLNITLPTSQEESESRRYKKCEHPKCGNVGTIDRPLDLHHIVPRSQSSSLIKDFCNHLYLCGDRFKENHHKALHGESTIGLSDWKKLGLFDDWRADADCSTTPEVDGLAERLVEFAQSDQICRTLLQTNPTLALDYIKRRNFFS
jgi:hypothetical protein